MIDSARLRHKNRENWKMDLATYEVTGRHEYEELARVVATILQAAIDQYGELRLQQIQHRAKEPASLRRKLEKENALASQEIEVAKDLAGVRLVFYTNSDVNRFIHSPIIYQNFDVLWDRTKFHHPLGDAPDAAEHFISNNYVTNQSQV